ncbi:MAG TPA: RNA polymerase sigma factor, partial [Acidimicrobiales bacterium]|nr:RNA polymerase sigma factor [Acidimicrobiales bacterium]
MGESAARTELRFRRLYDAYFDHVAGYLLARANKDEAAEALAHTFEVAWRRLGTIPDDAALPWLIGVARHVLSEVRRSASRQGALVARLRATAVAPAGGGDPADEVADRELLLSALGSLSPRHQEAVLLVAWDGLSEQEAAASLGISRGAFALRLYRARARLEQALGERGRTKKVAPLARYLPGTEH